MSGLKDASDVKAGDKLLGWAASEDVRSRGASGGLVTAMLAAALETGFVDRVLVLKRSANSKPILYLLRTCRKSWNQQAPCIRCL